MIFWYALEETMGNSNTHPQIYYYGSRPFHFRDSNGLSLITTLWILTVLSVLAMQMLYSYDLESKAQRNFLDRVKYHYAAKSGFEVGVAMLSMDETNFDSIGETWAEPIQQQIEDGFQIGAFIPYQVTITDEAARVNINEADVDLIRNLLSYLGAQPENNETGDLAARIVEGRPYRTVRDVARIEGMTNDILYGIQQQIAEEDATSGSDEPPPTTLSMTSVGGLVNTTTVYSVDTNTDSSGQQRVNINSANAQQLRQISSNNNQNIFSQAEANAIIQQRDYDGISDLLDASAVSDNVFNNISSEITVEESSSGGGNGGNNGRNGGGNFDFSFEDEGSSLININTADSDELTGLQGIDDGIAQRIIQYRNSQGFFQTIDDIKKVTLLSVQDLADIADKITARDGQNVNGLININTASVELLQLLPGMDQAKAQAIVNRREEENPDAQSGEENPVQGNPFSDIGQLLDIDEIDDNTFSEVVDWVTYRSHGYRIQSAAIDLTGKTIGTCIGIVVREGETLTIPYWRQD